MNLETSKRNLVKKLINLGYSNHYLLTCSGKYRGKPGEMMKKLTPEELELTKTLTAADFQDRIK